MSCVSLDQFNVSLLKKSTNLFFKKKKDLDVNTGAGLDTPGITHDPTIHYFLYFCSFK